MKNYNEKEESSYIQYLDANNLYGWAMSQELAINNFVWVENESKIKIEKLVQNYNENSGIRYIFEVDINYYCGNEQKINIDHYRKMKEDIKIYRKKI